MTAPLTITQAMIARFAASGLTAFDIADSTLPGYPGGLWLEEGPEQDVLPMAVLTHNGESGNEYQSEREYLEKGSHEFQIYGVGSAETERLALLVRAAFDPCIKKPDLFTIQNANVVSFERTAYRITVQPQRDELNRQVGLATFTYEYIVERTLPAS